MAPTTSSERQFDVCRRPANPAQHIKSPSRTSPQKPSTAPERSNFTPKSAARDTKSTSNVDSDASSELSSSSEEPSDDSDDEDEFANSADNEDPIVNLRANQGQKPIMKLDPEEMGDDIRSFLKDFLPKLKAANEELEAQKAAGTLKTAEILDDGDQTAGSDGDDEGEQYIELVSSRP
ncbi:unnamed protein product [Periconia digitata]|uniref:Uncharacterized protein n=1 Tax=Periconia digitata TaxID=1303443 RepID=A0A9W4XRF1_9PLEO|nr:unnamed protein product [Periconia digitata]